MGGVGGVKGGISGEGDSGKSIYKGLSLQSIIESSQI